MPASGAAVPTSSSSVPGSPGWPPRWPPTAADARWSLLSKAGETATFYAQGGIAVVLPGVHADDDSIDAHVADTLAAGAGLCDPEAVRSIVADGSRAVAELVGAGARFDESAPGQWALTREGGHSRRRIIHAGGDATGAEVQRALDHAAARLDIRRNHVALELLVDDGAVAGVSVLSEDGLGVVHAPSVILATGGLGHLYRPPRTPRDRPATASRWRCGRGSRSRDVEFIQFHPTMLYDRPGRRPSAADHRGAARRGRDTALTHKVNR